MSEQNKDEVQTDPAQQAAPVENTTTADFGADVEKALDADEQEDDGPGDETPVSDEEERETEDSDEDLPDDEDRGDAETEEDGGTSENDGDVADEVDTEEDDGGTGDDSDAAEEGSAAHTEILNRLSNIVAEQLGVSVGDVKSESNLQDDLGADSLDAVELVMAVEDEFELEIPDEKAESFKTVNDIVNYLIERNVTTG